MQERIPATVDEAVLMLYTYASRHVQQPLTRLYLLSPAMGDELVALWQHEHAQATFGKRQQVAAALERHWIGSERIPQRYPAISPDRL